MKATLSQVGGALAALAVLLAGCSDLGGARADDPTTIESGLPSDYEVPAVADPLDPGRFAADPCALLASEQRAGFGLPDTERNEFAGTVSCLLHPSGDTVTTVQL